MDDKSKKTKRAEENIISSGVIAGGKTQKDERPVIKSGVSVAPIPTTQIISAGIVNAVGGDIVLNGKTYKILKTISRSTGEAEVYLLERENQKYIFKYYYPAFKPKDTILKQLKGLTHEDIIALIDYGYYHDRFFEILEYAEGGTMMDVNPDGTYRYIPIKDMNRLKQIIKEVVNALEFCHSKGIIHRDIKPENIFFANPDGTDIKIGDFGISSSLDEGLSKRLTGQARTEIYAAPELYQNIGGKTIISKEVDYYALGITLIHIFSGEEPFKDLDSLAIMKIKCDGMVYIPEDMPEDLKNLIKGLITVEPSKRWGYEEVQKWLRGEYVPVYFKTLEFKYEPFPFGVIKGEDIIARDPVELSTLLLKYPDIGVSHLYKGRIERWLEKAKDPLFAVIESVREKEYPTDEKAGLIKTAYLLNPSKGYTTFSGIECKNPMEIGDAIEREFSYYKTYLTQNKNADLFLYLEARDEKEVADAFRKFAQAYKPERAVNMMILELQGKDKFKIENLIFTKPEDLLAADDTTKDKLIQLLKNPDSKLSIWLEQYPELKNNIDKWRKLGRFNTITLSYALEKDSPFHFEDTLARDANDFQKIFAKYLEKEDFLAKVIPGSPFTEEADFWLRNYHNIEFDKVIMDYLDSKTKVPLTDKEKYICERLAVLWIEEAHSKKDISKLDKFVNILEKIKPNHRWVIRRKKEKRLIDIMTKNKLDELSNKEKVELEKIVKEKKIAEENLRRRFKQKNYPILWDEHGKKATLTGIGTVVLWIIYIAQGGFKGEILLWIGAIIGGIIGLVWGLWGGLAGLLLGAVLGAISPFIITPVFLYYLIRALIEYNRINELALQIEISDDDKARFKQEELDLRNKIEKERQISQSEIIDEVLEMSDSEIDKNLEALAKS